MKPDLNTTLNENLQRGTVEFIHVSGGNSSGDLGAIIELTNDELQSGVVGPKLLNQIGTWRMAPTATYDIRISGIDCAGNSSNVQIANVNCI